jgi:hypothetical protein
VDIQLFLSIYFHEVMFVLDLHVKRELLVTKLLSVDIDLKIIKILFKLAK